MAYDRFVYFEKGKTPKRDDVGKVLEDYLGALLIGKEWKRDRWLALLVGKKSWPFRQVEDTSSAMAQAAVEEAKEERWIEVIVTRGSIDVLTRRQDELVNNVADGFAKLVARYWQGRLEMG